MTKKILALIISLILFGGISSTLVSGQAQTRKPTKTPKNTAIVRTLTITPSGTASVTPSRTGTPTLTLTVSPTGTLTFTPTITRTPSGEILPFYGATLCPDSGAAHDTSKWHSLWDGRRGCHYDHEHGANPNTPQVASAFPKFDLNELMCGVWIGHCNPTSLMENAHKHGGWKVQVQIPTPNDCVGFEGSPLGIRKSVIWYHNFGRYDVELESRRHSVIFLLEVCDPDNPNDVGQIFVTTHEEYGLRPAPYQGEALQYPDNPVPAYDPAFGPYWSTGCIGTGLPDCQQLTVADIVRFNQNVSATVTGKRTGSGTRPPVSRFPILFRSIDNYQAIDTNDLTHPFTWRFICSTDGGVTFNPLMVGCRWNNSTSMVHEVGPTVIPASWDNLAGFDTDPRVGRITAKGYVTSLGELNLNCSEPAPECHPIQLEQMFVGSYGASLAPEGGKGTFSKENLPERDICFTINRVWINCDLPGAISSGWINSEN